MEELPGEISAILIAGLTLLCTEGVRLLLKWKKNKNDVRSGEIKNESSELDNIEKAVAIWRELATDQQKTLDLLSDNQTTVLLQHKEIILQNISLNQKVDDYEKSIDTLTKHISVLERKVTILTDENKKLLQKLQS